MAGRFVARPGVEAGCFWAESLPVDPFLDGIRSNPRFPALLQMAHLGNVSKDAVSNAAVYVTPHSRGFRARWNLPDRSRTQMFAENGLHRIVDPFHRERGVDHSLRPIDKHQLRAQTSDTPPQGKRSQTSFRHSRAHFIFRIPTSSGPVARTPITPFGVRILSTSF